MEANDKLMAALALALVEKPRGSLLELARAAGISKATLYRFSRTREQLIERLMRHSDHAFNAAIARADLQTGAPAEALRRLIVLNLEHRELLLFVMHYLKDAGTNWEAGCYWETELDRFFLRGQQEGVFRIDVPAAAMTEIWCSVITGLVDAEQRGRIARGGLVTLIEQSVLGSIRSQL